MADADDFRCPSVSVALAGMPDDVGKRKLQVLFGGAQAEVLGVKEHERVQQHVGRVHAQLLTVPQMFFLHTREHQS